MKGKVRQIWCNGLKVVDSCPSGSKQVVSLKRKRVESSEANKKTESKRVISKEEREDKATNSMTSLKEKHKDLYTPMQYRIWSELIVSGAHESLEEPPTFSVFKRASKNDGSKHKHVSMSEALTHAAQAFSSALSPLTSTGLGHSEGTTSIIDLRSKCYKQLSELNNLKSTGVITEDEYLKEKGAIMKVLEQLK